jgi:hypothetical protein
MLLSDREGARQLEGISRRWPRRPTSPSSSATAASPIASSSCCNFRRRAFTGGAVFICLRGRTFCRTIAL